MKKTLALGILQLLIVIVSSKNIPSFMKVCKRNDPDLNNCIIRAFDVIRPYLIKGIPELDIPPGDPLHYLDASASTGKDQAVSVHGETWNQTATGLMDVEIKNISLDLNNAKCSAFLRFPHLRLTGDYKFLGKIMLFTIDTTGPFDINITELTTKLEMTGKLYMKNDKQHIEFEKVSLGLDMKKCSLHFANLINGNEVLSETVNTAINENIGIVFQELAPLLGDVHGGIAKQYFNKFFRMFSVDALFPRE